MTEPDLRSRLSELTAENERLKLELSHWEVGHEAQHLRKTADEWGNRAFAAQARLAAILAILGPAVEAVSKATAGPWFNGCISGGDPADWGRVFCPAPRHTICTASHDDGQTEEDFEAIVAAFNAIRQLSTHEALKEEQL